ncbi:SNARE-associated protein Snapin isoform X1 [Poecile atricapillus]|nr:SNARE-associated protein Snapin isoform X1 [Poecile atricapillus]
MDGVGGPWPGFVSAFDGRSAVQLGQMCFQRCVQLCLAPSLGTTFPTSPRGAHRKRPLPLPADSLSRQPLRRRRAKMAAGSGPGARELFAEGLLQFLRPAVRQLDRHVHSVRESQVELREHIDSLATELCRINEDQKVALDLDPYVKKLLNARRRVVLVNNILQNAQERLRRLNHSVAKETVRRRAMLEAGGYQGK